MANRNIPFNAQDSIIHQTFGLLTVMSLAGSNKHGKRTWKCLCECGNETTQTTGDLRGGRVVSCGCRNAKRISTLKLRHGNSPASGPTSEYTIWGGIIARCTKPNNRAYKWYGARGIGVCDRWMVFENFLEDMGKRPIGMSIDRINNDAGYSPDNCRWATQKEQTRNQKSNIKITINGSTRCLSEWCEITGVNEATARQRINAGFDYVEAVTFIGRATRHSRGNSNE